jgi:hypothetical protein
LLSKSRLSCTSPRLKRPKPTTNISSRSHKIYALRIGAGGTTIPTSPGATWYTRPDRSPGPQAGIARSATTSAAAAAPGISDRFFLYFAVGYWTVVRQFVGVVSLASDTTISMVQHDEMKLPTASRNLPGNLPDSPQQT